MGTIVRSQSSYAAFALAAFVVALLVALPYACPAAGVFGEGQISESALSNGMPVIVKEAHFAPLVAINVVIRAGRITEGEGTFGASHFVEHLLFSGARDPYAEPLGRRIEGIGGYINATTERDCTRLWCVVASEFLPEVLTALADGLIGVQIKDEAVEAERKVILQEIAMAEDRDLATVLQRMLWTAAYQTHPYGGPIPGTPADIGKLTASALQAYFDRYYVASNAGLVIVGDVSAAEAQRQAEKAFGEMPRGEPADLRLPADPPPDRIVTAAQKRAIPNALVGIAFRAPGIASKTEVCAMDVIYTVLGEGPGCRLVEKLVNEESVAFPVMSGGFCSYLTQRDPGLLIVMAGAAPGKAGQVRESVIREVRRIADEPLNPDELDRAKRLLRNAYAFGNETYQDQAFSLAFYQAIDTWRFALDYENAVMAVTAEQVQATARKYLSSDSYVVATIEPSGAPGGG